MKTSRREMFATAPFLCTAVFAPPYWHRNSSEARVCVVLHVNGARGVWYLTLPDGLFYLFLHPYVWPWVSYHTIIVFS